MQESTAQWLGRRRGGAVHVSAEEPSFHRLGNRSAHGMYVRESAFACSLHMLRAKARGLKRFKAIFCCVIK